MVPRLTILFVLIISTTCSILPLIPIHIQLVPILPQLPRQDAHIPNYSFSYNVNDEHTGDIKHQQETRHGGTVTGQYSLIQPDGIRRTVDYRADDARGFLATVNKHGANVIRQSDDNRQNDQSQQWQSDQRQQQPQQQQQLQQQQYQPQQQYYPQQQQDQIQLQQYQLQQQDQPQPQNLQNVAHPMSISRSSVSQSVQNVQSQGRPWA